MTAISLYDVRSADVPLHTRYMLEGASVRIGKAPAIRPDGSTIYTPSGEPLFYLCMGWCADIGIESYVGDEFILPIPVFGETRTVFRDYLDDKGRAWLLDRIAQGLAQKQWDNRHKTGLKCH